MLLSPERSPQLWNYGLAVVLVATAAILTMLLNQLGNRSIFALFYAAVALATWRGGLRAGLLAVLLSTPVIYYFFLPAPFTFGAGLHGTVQFAVFLLVTFLTASLIEARNRAEARAEARARQAETGQQSAQELHTNAEQIKAQLERILGGIKDDFVMYDPDWRYVYVNERAAQTLGYTKEQLIGQRIWDLFPAAVGNFFYQRVHQAVAEKREITFEFYYEPFAKWFENRAYPIADGLLLFTTDITERKRTEEKLRESEERMRLAIEANRIMTWDWNPLTDQVNTSQNIADIYGLTAVSGAAEGFAMIWPEDLPAHREKVTRITRGGGEYQSEFRVTRPVDGRTIWIEERASALTDREGRVIRLVGVVRDVTKRVEAQQQVQRWETEREELLQHLATEYERLETILQQTPAGIIIAAAPSGEAVLVNERTKQLTGYNFETNVELERYQEFQNFQGFHPDGRPYQPEEWPLARAIRQGEQVSSEEIELHRADGSRIVIQANASPIYNAEGRIVAGVTAFVDITAQKQAETDAQEARLMAEANHVRLARLQMVTAALSQALTPVQVAEVIVQSSSLLLNTRFGAISLLSADSSTLEMVYATGYTEEEVQQVRSVPLAQNNPGAMVVREGQPRWFESRAALLASYPHLASLRPERYEAAALVPLLNQERPLGLLALSFLEPRRFSTEEQDLLSIIARQCTQALERSRLYEIERQARQEAEANQQRLALLAEMRERNRLAQELHDTVAQALGYLNLKVGLTAASLNADRLKEANTSLQELKQVINETYTDVREEIFNLRAQTLSDLTFMELLARYLDKYRRFYNLDIQLSHEAETTHFEFSPSITSQVIRTIQEALINVRKHAQVNTALIRLRQDNGQPCISIEDEGQGFDLEAVKGKTTSFGLQIMRERIESVGGRLEIESAPNRGTRVTLWFK